MRSSIKLHNKMFSNILSATMRFFDTNPSGRILNRFSKDMGVVDEVMPRMFLDSIQVSITSKFNIVEKTGSVLCYVTFMVGLDCFVKYLIYLLIKLYIKHSPSIRSDLKLRNIFYMRFLSRQ